jgi:hypothetical protein
VHAVLLSKCESDGFSETAPATRACLRLRIIAAAMQITAVSTLSAHLASLRKREKIAPSQVEPLMRVHPSPRRIGSVLGKWLHPPTRQLSAPPVAKGHQTENRFQPKTAPPSTGFLPRAPVGHKTHGFHVRARHRAPRVVELDWRNACPSSLR